MSSCSRLILSWSVHQLWTEPETFSFTHNDIRWSPWLWFYSQKRLSFHCLLHFLYHRNYTLFFRISELHCWPQRFAFESISFLLKQAVWSSEYEYDLVQRGKYSFTCGTSLTKKIIFALNNKLEYNETKTTIPELILLTMFQVYWVSILAKLGVFMHIVIVFLGLSWNLKPSKMAVRALTYICVSGFTIV